MNYVQVYEPSAPQGIYLLSNQFQKSSTHTSLQFGQILLTNTFHLSQTLQRFNSELLSFAFWHFQCKDLEAAPACPQKNNCCVWPKGKKILLNHGQPAFFDK